MSQSPYPSWQPWEGQGRGVPQPWGGQLAPSMLAAHADRERAVDVLRAGYAEGRMEHGEFEKRVARAYAARTVGELALLVADLPQGPVPRPVPVQAAVPGMFSPVARPRTNGKAVSAAVCGLLCVPTFGLTGIPAGAIRDPSLRRGRRRARADRARPRVVVHGRLGTRHGAGDGRDPRGRLTAVEHTEEMCSKRTRAVDLKIAYGPGS